MSLSAHRMIPSPLDGEPRQRGILTLPIPPSLNNAFVNGPGRGGRFKSAGYKTWQTLASLQLRRQEPWHIPGKISIRIVYDRQHTKADLDNLIKPILDLLVAAGRISDDRNVEKIEAEFGSAPGVLVGIQAAASKEPTPVPVRSGEQRSGTDSRTVQGPAAAVGRPD